MSDFGVLVSDFEKLDAKIRLAKQLGTNLMRNAYNSLKNFRTQNFMMTKYADNNIRAIMNYNWDLVRLYGGERVPNRFPTDMGAYRTQLTKAVRDTDKTVCGGKPCVIENEELNSRYHIGPIEDYFEMLNVAADVCHNNGYKVCNGGAPNSGLALQVTYGWQLMSRGQAQADEFAALSLMSNYEIKNGKYIATGEGAPKIQSVRDKLDDAKKLMEFIKTSSLDYHNFHYYEPLQAEQDENISINGVLTTIAKSFGEWTGKPVMSNETGQHNYSPQLVDTMLRAWHEAGAETVIWYSGNSGSDAAPLNDGIELLDNGKQWRTTVGILTT